MFSERISFDIFEENFPKRQAEFITKFVLEGEGVGQKTGTSERIFECPRLQNLVKFSPVTSFSKLDLGLKSNRSLRGSFELNIE
jgi:hypothetical protein